MFLLHYHLLLNNFIFCTIHGIEDRSELWHTRIANCIMLCFVLRNMVPKGLDMYFLLSFLLCLIFSCFSCLSSWNVFPYLKWGGLSFAGLIMWNLFNLMLYTVFSVRSIFTWNHRNTHFLVHVSNYCTKHYLIENLRSIRL